MEAVCSSEILVNFYQTTWHHIPDDSTLDSELSDIQIYLATGGSYFLFMPGFCDLYIFAVFKSILIFHCMYVIMVTVPEKARERSRKEKVALEAA
jgi:hypothetical protein